MIKAVLFDMDGVLIDAKDWHYDALNRALHHFGHYIEYDAHLSVYDGLPTKHKLEILSKTRGLPTGLHGLVNQLKQKYTMSIAFEKCKPVFHHQMALSKLKKDGYKMMVCSNSIRPTVETLMTLSDLAQYLDGQLSNEDVTKSKPDPEIYNLAISKLGLKPTECVVVEDNENGILAARESGAHVLVVSDTKDVTYERISAFIASSDK